MVKKKEEACVCVLTYKRSLIWMAGITYVGYISMVGPDGLATMITQKWPS